MTAGADRLLLEEWPAEPTPGQLLFPTQSRYVERLWLPILGPTATVTLRLLAELVAEASPRAADVAMEDLATAVGLGAGTSQNSPFGRSLRRLARHTAIRLEEARALVRTELPPIGGRDLARLPEHLQQVHARLLAP